ncbi:MAG: FtsX-like permease family protein [Rhodothermales bacterium]|nr:FtsX-like permease family protein [Rhodothermales bacterium]
MLKNYVTSALRNFRKHPTHSFINVAGLGIGLACCLAILMYVRDEVTFDRFHADGQRIYRINKVVTPQEGGEERHAISSGLMGPTMAADFPEVEAVLRVLPWFDAELTTAGGTSVMLDDILLADAGFFQFFDFELLRGAADRVLVNPLSIVLTESTARRFFGDSDPIGRTIESLNGFEYTVTGIAADAPKNSHLPFNAVISWATTVPGTGPMNAGWLNNWLTQVMFTYVRLIDGAAPVVLEEKLPAFMERHFAERAEQYALYLQPLSDIYLNSTDLRFTRGQRTGSRAYVRTFSLVAVLVLIIACINFMNLSTARASERSREVGVRKALGARKEEILRQYLSEALVFVLVSILLALSVVQASLPLLTDLTGKELGLSTIGVPRLAGILAGLAVVCTLLAGFYPALLLSRFRPESALRASTAGGLSGAGLRRILVTFQFAATVVLIAGTAVVYRQVQFSQDLDPGFDRDQILYLRTGDTDVASSIEAFREEIMRLPGVVLTSVSGTVPGEGTMSFSLEPEGKPESESWTSNVLRISDADMAETWGFEMADGRFFEPDRPTDSETGVVINETLARSLGWDDAVGRGLSISGEMEDGLVIGVMRDFHFESVHSEIGPLVMFVAPRPNYLSVRFEADRTHELLSSLEDLWTSVDTAHPFDYAFADQQWASMYRTEQKLMQTLSAFAVLAILVACLGLMGLAMHTTARRTKEIGIRKVLGATAMGIVRLLSREFAALVVIGTVLAAPVAWLAADAWLSGFAYRIDLGPAVFVLAGAGALALALGTVLWQALRAASANPADSLRSE